MNLFSLYSLKNEIDTVKDKLGRVRTFSVLNDFHTPIISKKLFESGFTPIYPENKKMCVVLSHDVDYIYNKKSPIGALKNILKELLQFKISKVVEEVKMSILGQRNQNWLLDRIINFEKSNNINSTYFFLGLKENDKDFNYRFIQLKDYVEKIIENKSEIGFHGGLDAFNNERKFYEELNELKIAFPKLRITGYRSHFLMYDHFMTHDLLEKFGFDYDSSLGIPDNVGFRNGMCYPYRPINLATETPTYRDIIEIPLNVMDVSFFKYMNLDLNSAFDLFLEIYHEVKEINGVVSILWHNNNFEEDYAQLYYRIMDFILKDNDSWIATHSELSEHWRKNNLSNLELYLNKITNNVRKL